MAAGNYSFTIEQGTTVDFELQYTDANNDPIDLTGHWAKMQIKNNFADSSPTTYLTLSSSLNPDGTGLNLSGSSNNNSPVSGTIGVFIAATTSSLLTFTKAKYDIELYSGDPESPIVTRMLEGTVSISKQVTTDS